MILVEAYAVHSVAPSRKRRECIEYVMLDDQASVGSAAETMSQTFEVGLKDVPAVSFSASSLLGASLSSFLASQ